MALVLLRFSVFSVTPMWVKMVANRRERCDILNQKYVYTRTIVWPKFTWNVPKGLGLKSTCAPQMRRCIKSNTHHPNKKCITIIQTHSFAAHVARSQDKWSFHRMLTMIDDIKAISNVLCCGHIALDRHCWNGLGNCLIFICISISLYSSIIYNKQFKLLFSWTN